MKNFVEEYGKTIIVAILIIALILVATLFATEGKDSILDIFRHLRGPSYEMTTSPSTVKPGEDATFVSAAPFDKFNEVRIDGKVLDPDNYTASGESTKITLKGSYTETLDEGKHTIEIISDDGYAEAEFEVLDGSEILITGSKFMRKIPGGATSVIFTDAKAPDGAALTDVSEAQDGSIVAWLDETTYKVSTQKSGAKVFANPDSSQMFNGNISGACNYLTNIDATNLDTSKVTDMSEMFRSAGYYANTFIIKGLSSWDTSKVTSMSYMFFDTGYNSSEFTLDLSGWNTSKVTDMGSMFNAAGFKASTWSVGNLSSWDTSQVTDMRYMFGSTGNNASTFSIGDLSGWDTSKAINMVGMFSHAGFKASTFNIGNLGSWDISSAKSISGMFDHAGYNASTWSIGDLSGWDTSQATNMSRMFESAGRSANTWNIGNLSGWNTSQVTDMSFMFNGAGCRSNTFTLEGLSGWNTSQVTNMSYMFNYTGYDASGWSIDCSSWNVNKVTNNTSFNKDVASKVTAPNWVN